MIVYNILFITTVQSSLRWSYTDNNYLQCSSSCAVNSFSMQTPSILKLNYFYTGKPEC